MQITSTGRAPLHRPQPQPLKKLEFDSLEAKDPDDLNHFLRDLELRQRAREREMVPKLKRAALSNFAASGALYSGLGGVLGAAINGIPGAALGVAAGAYLAWNSTWRQDVGTVTIETDGVVRKTPYYMDPTAYHKEEEDWTFTDKPSATSVEASIETNTLPQAQAARPKESTIATLAEERKLVAPSLSKGGEPLLKLVDAGTAESLLAAGREIYAVAGQSKDSLHRRRVTASNPKETTSRVVDEAVIQRTYTYQLRSLQGSETLNSLPEGQGLPLGLSGVFRDANSCSRVVSADKQDGRVDIRRNASSLSFQQQGFTGDETVSLQQRRIQGGIVTSVNIRDPIMMLGALIGIAGASALGAPQWGLAGLVGGGIVGRELGTIAQRRMPTRQHSRY